MKQKSLVSQLEKAGLKVETEDNHFFCCVSKNNKRILEWYEQEGFAICLVIRRHNDISDSITDYSAGYGVSTIKHALKRLLEV